MTSTQLRRKDVWFALVLLALLSVTVWVGRRPAHEPAPPAGSVPLDDETARAELELIEQRYPAQRDSGNLDQALTEITRVVEKYPGYAAARVQMALVLAETGRSESAYIHLKKCLDLDNQQPNVELLAGTFAMQLNDLTGSAHHFSRAVGLAPENGEYRVYLAQVQIRRHQFDAARMTLLDALRLDSSLHEAYFSLADVFARQNELQLALQQVQKAIENTPIAERKKQIGYILRKAKLLQRMNQPEQSLQTLRHIPARRRQELDVLEEMAISWNLLKRPEKSAELYEQVLAQRPTQWRLAAGAARWQIASGEVEKARKHLERIQYLDSEAPAIPNLEKQIQRLELERATRSPTDSGHNLDSCS